MSPRNTWGKVSETRDPIIIPDVDHEVPREHVGNLVYKRGTGSWRRMRGKGERMFAN